ncbi:MAG: ATP synthase F0 subunit B [Chlorobiaceae bacterium]|nr:ATP synthase F0 subunit B [Chlorobiaceae bacterium]MBA4310277.1 ATP synthase F0 subunit B [Chlorobiaceae bacterium]
MMYAETESGGSGGLLSVNAGLAFWTTLTFLILLFLLKKFAWKPILKALDEREKKIKESLELAQRAKEDAEKMMLENKSNLLRAEEESKKIIEQSKEFAEKLKNQIIDESKDQAKKLIENASAEIDRKKLETFEELKIQVANLSIEIAEKVIRKNLDRETQNKIVSNYIDEIQKN